MNDNTERLVRELAEKLGTTVEHLWGVLLRQAPLSATSDLIQLGIMVLACWLLYKAIRFCGRKSKEDRYNDDGWIAAIVVLVAILLFCLISATILIGNIPKTIAGFTNPEYWAFCEIYKK